MLVVKDDIKALTKDLTYMQRKQVPYASVLAINNVGWKLTGYRGKEGILSREVAARIDRPRRTDVFFFEKATKAKPWGVVKFKDKGKGIYPAKYFRAQVFGGKRRPKRHEVALRRMGILGDNEFTVPGNAMKLDKYGNLTGATYSKILADVNQTNTGGNDIAAGFGQRTTRRGKKKYFYDPNLRPRGIWVRQNRTRIFPALVFVAAPSYGVRYPMEDLADFHAQRRFPGAFRRALERALKTARR